MAPKANTREGRVRDRWVAGAAFFAVACFLAHGVHVFVSDARLEVVAVISIALGVASMAMAVRWNKRANPDADSARQTVWKLRWVFAAAVCFATGAFFGRTVPGYFFWNAAWVLLLINWLLVRRAERSN